MIKVFKFGGASVKNAEAVRNLSQILKQFSDSSLVIVVSAMGKTTNALEKLLEAACEKASDFDVQFDQIKEFHVQIIDELFGESSESVKRELETYFISLRKHFTEAGLNCSNDKLYDQTVSYGELISSFIVFEWLKFQQLKLRLIDAREFVMTDQNYRSSNILWDETSKRTEILKADLTIPQIMLTQGFIGSAPDRSTTTLGREGSDFTAAIFAYCLNAEEVIIWKDVPGLLNADPKRFANTVKLNGISYSEAIELAYYGATIIHPKTIKPLQNKGIPLKIKSFLEPELLPSVISENNSFDSSVPSYIIKDNQLLVSLSPRDFSFMDEGCLHTIFGLLNDWHIHVNLLQTSALSLSICVDFKSGLSEKMLELFGSDFIVKYNQGLTLLTIRHYQKAPVESLTQGKAILLEQRSRTTLQFVYAEDSKPQKQ